jgi:hypothetical protein
LTKYKRETDSSAIVGNLNLSHSIMDGITRHLSEEMHVLENTANQVGLPHVYTIPTTMQDTCSS